MFPLYSDIRMLHKRCPGSKCMQKFTQLMENRVAQVLKYICIEIHLLQFQNVKLHGLKQTVKDRYVIDEKYFEE